MNNEYLNNNKLKDKIMKNFKLISAAAGIIILITGCMSEKNKGAAITGEDSAGQVPVIKVTELKPVTIARSVDFTATVLPFDEVNMSPSTPGRIDRIFVEVGDRVRKGDNLFLMDRTQLIQARIQLASLEKDLARLDTLLRAGSARQQQYDQLKTQYELMKSNVSYLDENTLLEAPFSGVITGRYFEEGEMYSGAPTAASGGKSAIVTLMQINPVKLTINVSEQYFTLVKKGMPVRISSDVYKNQLFTGTISLVYPTVNPLTRSFQTEIEIPNKDEKLRPGMFVRVSLDLEKIETFAVPASTVLIQEGTNIRYVFVEKDGMVSRVEVIPGKRYDDMVEIISESLVTGDRIVVQGQARLTSGDKVKVVN